MQNSISRISQIIHITVLDEICRQMLEEVSFTNLNLSVTKVKLSIPKPASYNYILVAINLPTNPIEYWSSYKTLLDETNPTGKFSPIFRLNEGINNYLIHYFYCRYLFITGGLKPKGFICGLFVKITKIDLEFLENVIFFSERVETMPLHTKIFIRNLYFVSKEESIERLKELYIYLKSRIEMGITPYFHAY